MRKLKHTKRQTLSRKPGIDRNDQELKRKLRNVRDILVEVQEYLSEFSQALTKDKGTKWVKLDEELWNLISPMIRVTSSMDVMIERDVTWDEAVQMVSDEASFAEDLLLWNYGRGENREKIKKLFDSLEPRLES